ncbi:MAG: hypothetical protein ACYCV5_08490, partial [Acidimicrobiales bacterium]
GTAVRRCGGCGGGSGGSGRAFQGVRVGSVGHDTPSRGNPMTTTAATYDTADAPTIEDGPVAMPPPAEVHGSDRAAGTLGAVRRSRVGRALRCAWLGTVRRIGE